MKTRLLSIVALCASASLSGQVAGDIRYQYYSAPTTLVTTWATPPTGVPSIGYHTGTLTGAQFAYMPLGNSLTLVSGHVEANFANLIGKPTALSQFTDDLGLVASATYTSGLAGKENTISAGTSAQYYRGDKTWVAFPTSLSSFTNTPGYITGVTSGMVTTALGFTPGTGTVASVSAGTGLSGGTITGSGTISMPATGTAGTYSGVTTDTQGRVTAGTVRSFNSAPGRSLNSAFQISSTRDSLVSYSVDIAASATLLGGQTGTVFLEYADDSAHTTNVVEVARFVNGNSVALAIAITVNQSVTGTLTGMVPAGKYVKIRTANTAGTPTFNYRSAQEVLV